MEFGLQFHLPSHPRLTVPELVELARRAADGGIGQVWVSDNLRSRSALVVLGALASGRLTVKLGTAIMVQYLRNPVDAAAALAAITESMEGAELGVGIGRGNSRTARSVATPRPVSMMRETAQCLRSLFDGKEVAADDVPTLAAYFHLTPGARFRLGFRPTVPIRLYCGADGPKGLAVGGATTDGLLCGTTFLPIAGMGRAEELLRIYDDAAAAGGRQGKTTKVAEIKVSLSRDASAARAFARRGVGSRVLGLKWRGYGADDIGRLGITPDDVDRLERAAATSGGSSEELEGHVTDAMIDAFYVAGDLGHCRDRLTKILETATAHGVEQLMFSGLSPDLPDGIQLLCGDVLPELASET